MPRNQSKYGLLRCIPLDFDCFGYQVPVILDEEMFQEESKDCGQQDGEQAEGLYSPDQHAIFLDPSIENPEHRLEVFCHEFTECMNHMLDLNLAHSEITAIGGLLSQMLLTGTIRKEKK